MILALTRPVSPTIVDCALSYMERTPIDLELAIRQHGQYEACLERLGARLLRVPAAPELPDAVFVEDTVVAVDEVAVLTTPALASRRREVASVAEALTRYRPLERIGDDAQIEGGDVMRIGGVLYVGLSRRTNVAGIERLAAILAPHGYQ